MFAPAATEIARYIFHVLVVACSIMRNVSMMNTSATVALIADYKS